MKLLFLSPHPDDSEIGCGGTIRKYAENGCIVHIAVMSGEGDLKMVHSGETVPFKTRMREQLDAAKQLGVSESNVHFLNVGPASKLDTVPLVKGVEAIESMLDLDVDKLFIPLPSFNQDHTYTYEAALAATRPYARPNLEVYAYEQPSNFHGTPFVSPCRAYVRLHPVEFLIKKSAIACHASQSVSANFAYVDQLGKLRGSEVGWQAAEMFYPLKVFL